MAVEILNFEILLGGKIREIEVKVIYGISMSFVVKEKGAYLFTLVPAVEAMVKFDICERDKDLDIEYDYKLLCEVSDCIDEYFD